MDHIRLVDDLHICFERMKTPGHGSEFRVESSSVVIFFSILQSVL